MTEMRETLKQWLRDAHAMETSTVGSLDKLSERMSDFPEIRSRIQQHREESKGHVERVERCLDLLDAGPSAVKEFATRLSSNVQQLVTMMTQDEPVKQLMAAHAFEHFEIASYKALQGAAEAAGMPEISRIAGEIMREEQAMADFFAEQLPKVARQYVMSEAA